MIAKSFSIPVLLVPPVGSATSSASDSPEKYRYLTSVPFIHIPPTISEMRHDVLQSVRKNADNLKLGIHPLNIVPPAGPTLTIVQEVNESSAQLRREHIATAAKKRKSPSTGAHTAEPPPPITLYHPVFAKFLQLMAEPQEFTSEELNHAHSFVTLAAAHYRYKDTRREKLRSVMGAAVHNSILASKALSYASRRLKPDGAVSSVETPDGFLIITAIHEVKLEIGDGGSDPIAQGECDYAAVYSSNEARPIREVCCCPAFIVGMAGPNIIVSGAVFVDQLVAQTLTDYISVVPRPSHDARAMTGAPRSTMQAIKIYPPPAPPAAGVVGGHRPFRGSTAGGRILNTPSMISPHFTRYRDDSGKEVVLTYKTRLIPDVSMKAVFLVEAKSGSETATVVVKFAYEYNREAHNLLATASPQQAPKLRYCAYEASVRMQVVVMDYVEGREVDDVLTQPAHIESLRRALKTLHASNFVFGDLRAPNVLIVDDRVVLIDFDWCGKAGEARYPSDIALGVESAMWHSGVRRGGLIEKAHDKYHFRALTKEDL
ncbi:hypothetical protein B0H21DRAFT_820351 [Amylocystis lapponica]|nr:hypothetical protein B0H21DRAFT_820351 [Amylocystis lapponica]